jgi:hypothetical protein
MKKAIAAILQFLLFFFVFGLGSILTPFHIQHVLTSTPAATRIFIADGLLLMLGLYVLIVVIEALTKRLRTAAPWTTLALILATVLGLIMKFGFLTRSAY